METRIRIRIRHTESVTRSRPPHAYSTAQRSLSQLLHAGTFTVRAPAQIISCKVGLNELIQTVLKSENFESSPSGDTKSR